MFGGIARKLGAMSTAKNTNHTGIGSIIETLNGPVYSGTPEFERLIRDMELWKDPYMNTGLSQAVYSAVIQKPGAIDSETQRMQQIEVRMRMHKSDLLEKLHGLSTTYVDDKVYVHFVRAGKLQVFEDEPGMFPSDTLINSLRLCL